jgi:hypothetical protein
MGEEKSQKLSEIEQKRKSRDEETSCMADEIKYTEKPIGYKKTW